MPRECRRDSFERQRLSAAPILMASREIPNTTQLASSWAMVCAPLCLISSIPCAPSAAIQVSSAAVADGPAVSATKKKRTSTDGLLVTNLGAALDIDKAPRLASAEPCENLREPPVTSAIAALPPKPKSTRPAVCANTGGTPPGSRSEFPSRSNFRPIEMNETTRSLSSWVFLLHPCPLEVDIAAKHWRKHFNDRIL